MASSPRRSQTAVVTYRCSSCGAWHDRYGPDPDAQAERRIQYCAACDRICPLYRTEVSD